MWVGKPYVEERQDLEGGLGMSYFKVYTEGGQKIHSHARM